MKYFGKVRLPRLMHRLSSCYWRDQFHFKHSKGAYTPTESSRVQSSPVRLTKTQQRLCGLLTMAAVAVRTHQQSRIESSHTSLAESRIVMPHASFSSVRLGRDRRNACREISSFSEEPGGNLRRLALWTPEPLLTLMMMFLTTGTTAPLTTVIMI